MTDGASEGPVGYVIFGDEGDIVHGNDWDPFGLPILSILTHGAVDTAQAWIDNHPEAAFRLVPVFRYDVAPGVEFVESISLKDEPTLSP